MCILMLQDKKQKVTEQEFRNSWISNNDGVGYAFLKDEQIQIKKFMKLNPFLNEIKKDVSKFGNVSPFLIHFRYTTHGLTNLDNCHPFRVNDDSVFGHNGCISSVDDDDEKSDTRMFNEQVLKELPSKWMWNPSICKLVADSIGNSKLAFLNSDGTFKIINESFGKWDKHRKIWFSNNSHIRTIYKPVSVNSFNDYFKNESILDSEDDSFYCDWCNTLDYELNTINNQNICKDCKIEYDNQLKQVNFKFK